jgi:hypothetical protein
VFLCKRDTSGFITITNPDIGNGPLLLNQWSADLCRSAAEIISDRKVVAIVYQSYKTNNVQPETTFLAFVSCWPLNSLCCTVRLYLAAQTLTSQKH